MIIAIYNPKGGVGKTTTTINLAAGLAEFENQRVLIVDMSGRSHLGLLYPAPVGTPNISDVMLGGVHASDAVMPTDLPNLHILHGPPCDIAALGGVLASRHYSGQILQQALSAIDGRYDFTLIDCPSAAPSYIDVNLLIAADALLVPVQTEPYSVQGFHRVTAAHLRDIGLEALISPPILGILLTMVRDRIRVSRHCVAAMVESHGDHLFSAVIHEDKKVRESEACLRSVLSHAPKTRAAQEYRALAGEVMQRAFLCRAAPHFLAVSRRACVQAAP